MKSVGRLFRSWRNLTRSLTRLQPRHLDQAGAKAVTLGRMLRAELPVPPGFVLGAQAFRSFVQSSPEWPELRAALAASQTGDPSEVEALSRRIRRALENHPLPNAVERALAAALGEFPAASLWAVRSSATAEDLPGASFAGQHDSFLNVPRGEVSARVRACWLSLFSPRALSYRRRHRLGWEGAAMAVIVQQMIPAQLAGVLFTAEPASGNRNRMVIEAAPGLGDNVLSGRAAPEQVVLDRLSLAVVKRSSAGLSPPPEIWHAGAWHDGGGKADPVLVSDALAARLASLAFRLEALLSGPLDIEWAVCQGEAHLLQARPISGKTVGQSWEDRQAWTNLNTGEIFPDVVTPITWSLLQILITPLFASVFRLFGADVTKAAPTGLVAGRVYFNVNTGLAALQPFSFALGRVPDIALALGGGQVSLYDRLVSDLRSEDFPNLGFRWPSYICSWPRLLLDLIKHSPRRGAAFSGRLKARGDLLASQDFDSLSAPELARAFLRILRENLGDWDLLYLFTRAGALLVFAKACRDWLGDNDFTLASRLFSALGGLPDTEAGLALWRLAACAHNDPQTERLLASGDDWPELRPRLGQAAHGRQFLAAWDAFMKEHGHHCRGEIELFNARWSESPDYILSLVRSYLRSIDQTHPLERQLRLARQRLELTGQCRQRLKNPLKRWIFTRVLSRVQRLAIDREVWKNEIVRHIAVLRRILVRLGTQLQERGVLARRDDIFFLEVSEIEPVGTGQADFDLRAVIERRRCEHQQNLPLRPPPVVKGRFAPESSAVPPADPGARVLMGIPVFPGTVTGRARVILHTDDLQVILPGEILIAPFTDPAWTPYFVPAAGAVMDQGGVLSHGSIIAREYGLPAVTNVGSATRLIQTGDLVRVEGQAGRVTILERAPERA